MGGKGARSIPRKGRAKERPVEPWPGVPSLLSHVKGEQSERWELKRQALPAPLWASAGMLISLADFGSPPKIPWCYSPA